MGSQSPGSPNELCIRVVQGPNAEKVYQLTAKTVVGRGPEVDVFVEHPFVARRHFVLVWNEDSAGHMIVDGWLRPQVPVVVNGRPIGERERTPLAVGDTLTIANTTFVYEHLTSTVSRGAERAS